MKIKTIEYPTSLEKITDPFNDNIDVFVETEDGYQDVYKRQDLCRYRTQNGRNGQFNHSAV